MVVVVAEVTITVETDTTTAVAEAVAEAVTVKEASREVPLHQSPSTTKSGALSRTSSNTR